MTDAEKLLLEIARCSIARGIREDACTDSPCREVVGYQKNLRLPFHLPEPWSGHIEKARLLFISSNPSIDYNEDYPDENWGDGALIGFFRDRFTADRPWINAKNQTLQVFGDRGRSVHFLRQVRRLANDIIPGARPGLDYALTEVVHCKSKGQEGVKTAVQQCATSYLDKILDLAKDTRVLVGLGDYAESEMRDRSKLEPVPGSERVRRDSKSGRLIIFLPHPSVWRFKKYSKSYPSAEDLEILAQG